MTYPRSRRQHGKDLAFIFSTVSAVSTLYICNPALSEPEKHDRLVLYVASLLKSQLI